MTDLSDVPQGGRGPRWVAPVALAMIVGLFGGMVSIGSFQLREELRERVVQRYAEIWASISKFQVVKGLEDDFLSGLRFEDTIAYALMEAQDVEGSLGVQIFDDEGIYLAGVPFGVDDDPLDAEKIARFKSGAPWGNWLPSGQGTARLELFVPIRSEAVGELLVLARYLMEGAQIESEFVAIDSRLAKQATLAFLGGTALVSAIFLWSFRKLRKARLEVEERAARLAAANAELAMVAKTSAIGAVASHLIHGLRNPLAGIREHIASDGEGLDSEDWDDAKQAARRMQSMINEVVDVLRNERIDDAETLDGEYLKSYLISKYRRGAERKRLDFGFRLRGDANLSARRANIAKLIVSNLVENAIDATSVGGEVEVRIEEVGSAIDITVLDTGKGFSERARESLFQTKEQSTEGGAGIGLAISKQLSRHIGAELELLRTGSSGTEMRLRVPIEEGSGSAD